MPIEAYKPLGLVSVVVFWSAIILLLRGWKVNRGMSISRHVSASKLTYVLAAIVESILVPLFILFFVKWFAPTFHLPVLFSILVTFSMLGFLVAAWVPDTKGSKSFVHGFSAYLAGILLIPATAFVCASEYISPTARAVSYTTLFYEIVSLSLFFSTRKAQSYHLYLQSIYLILFDIAILITAYVR
jgi:hypothetical protein